MPASNKLLRVATANVENLFARFRFSQVPQAPALGHGWRLEPSCFQPLDEPAQRRVAQVLNSLHADVLALQEVESFESLRLFRDRFLHGGREAWPHVLLLPGNDSKRQLHLALLSRYPIVHARSYAHLWDTEAQEPLFSRDCLEADIQVDGFGTLTLYVNHFKSLVPPQGGDPRHGRGLTAPKRRAQAHAVRHLIEQRFGLTAGTHPFIVLGALNDYPEQDEQGLSSLTELVRWEEVEDVLCRLPREERWTHYYKGDVRHGLSEAYRQLDYLLLSRRLAYAAPRTPIVERRGLTPRARRFNGLRFEGVEAEHKASDHCPLLIELQPW